ncbi:hypothetical protein BDF14DRAFT_1908149 [Spinellus fusiger]|nr:hypothetical protein BDF14DRAFT_1908149 [Spinellus fusiger]
MDIQQAKRAAIEAQMAKVQHQLALEQEALAKIQVRAAAVQAKEAVQAAQAAQAAQAKEAAEERKRQEAFKASQQEQRRRAEESRQREEEEMTLRAAVAAEEERRRAEKVAAAAAEQERLRQEECERAIARMHREALISQLSNRWVNELIERVIQQQSLALAAKALHQVKKLETTLKPWVSRARTRVEKRNEDALKRIARWHFNMYKAGVKPWQAGNARNRKGEGTVLLGARTVKQRVTESLKAEENALSKTVWPTQNQTEAVWRPEVYAQRIYPLIKKPMMEFEPDRHDTTAKSGWQLWIHLADRQEQSADWIKKKFALDDVFSRHVQRYQEMIITIRSVTPQDGLYRKAVNELGAVLFCLSEIKTLGVDDCDNTHYWDQERRRLHGFLNSLCQYNPGIQVPIVFAYWPTTTTLENSLNEIPKRLELLSSSVITDFRIMIMSPITIVTRLDEEVQWLAVNMVINQPTLLI